MTDVTRGGAVSGQYPLKKAVVGELARDAPSPAADTRLHATVSRPGTAVTPGAPPDNVLTVTVHGLYNPPWPPSADAECTAAFGRVPEAGDPVRRNNTTRRDKSPNGARAVCETRRVLYDETAARARTAVTSATANGWFYRLCTDSVS